MGNALVPVLWLYGPAGVGKTTVAWELFTQLTRGGTPTGYVDIDPAMCAVSACGAGRLRPGGYDPDVARILAFINSPAGSAR